MWRIFSYTFTLTITTYWPNGIGQKEGTVISFLNLNTIEKDVHSLLQFYLYTCSSSNSRSCTLPVPHCDRDLGLTAFSASLFLLMAAWRLTDYYFFSLLLFAEDYGKFWNRKKYANINKWETIWPMKSPYILLTKQ